VRFFLKEKFKCDEQEHLKRVAYPQGSRILYHPPLLQYEVELFLLLLNSLNKKKITKDKVSLVILNLDF